MLILYILYLLYFIYYHAYLLYLDLCVYFYFKFGYKIQIQKLIYKILIYIFYLVYYVLLSLVVIFILISFGIIDNSNFLSLLNDICSVFSLYQPIFLETMDFVEIDDKINNYINSEAIPVKKVAYIILGGLVISVILTWVGYFCEGADFRAIGLFNQERLYYKTLDQSLIFNFPKPKTSMTGFPVYSRFEGMNHPVLHVFQELFYHHPNYDYSQTSTPYRLGPLLAVDYQVELNKIYKTIIDLETLVHSHGLPERYLFYYTDPTHIAAHNVFETKISHFRYTSTEISIFGTAEYYNTLSSPFTPEADNILKFHQYLGEIYGEKYHSYHITKPVPYSSSIALHKDLIFGDDIKIDDIKIDQKKILEIKKCEITGRLRIIYA